jgi:hypothetical protein
VEVLKYFEANYRFILIVIEDVQIVDVCDMVDTIGVIKVQRFTVGEIAAMLSCAASSDIQSSVCGGVPRSESRELFPGVFVGQPEFP